MEIIEPHCFTKKQIPFKNQSLRIAQSFDVWEKWAENISFHYKSCSRMFGVSKIHEKVFDICARFP